MSHDDASHAHDPAVEHLDPLMFGETQRCFGCGPNNPLGMKLKFTKEGNAVVTRFVAPQGMEGPPGVFHGGLQATVADEVAGWALVGLLGRMGFTTSMQVRYVRPMRIGEEIVARATLASHTGNIATLHVTLTQHGRTGLSGTVSYMLPDVTKAESYLKEELPESWRRLFGG